MMNPSTHAAVILINAAVLVASAQAQSNSKGPNSPVFVGSISNVGPSGTMLEVQQSDGALRQLSIDAESRVYFVGFATTEKHTPREGMGVKATCQPDGRVKTISLTPPVGPPSAPDERRLTMTERQLFQEVDKDASRTISYVEFSRHVFYSPKHGPDSFRKADKDANGLLDTAEFGAALSKVSWWKLSRQTPDDWFRQADSSEDGLLDVKEFAMICTSGNHIENIFKRTDRDESGHLSARETAAYIRSVTHGKLSRKSKREQTVKE